MATINAFFYSALKSSEYLAGVLGKSQKMAEFKKSADDLKIIFNREFWNEPEMAYNSAFYNGKVYAPTAHAQLIALHYNLVPQNRMTSAQKWFLSNYKNSGMKHIGTNADFEKMVNQKTGIEMPVTYFWVFSQLYRMDSDKLDTEAIQEIRRRWTPMVVFQQDAGTLCESFTDEKGEGASESCHNYGSVPAFFLSSYVLGVRTDGPVWKNQIVIEPRLGDLTNASGVVVTQSGPVTVLWKRSNKVKSLEYAVNIPTGIHATLHLPQSEDKTNLTMNGKVLISNGVPAKGIKTKGRWIVIQNIPEKCSGRLD